MWQSSIALCGGNTGQEDPISEPVPTGPSDLQ